MAAYLAMGWQPGVAVWPPRPLRAGEESVEVAHREGIVMAVACLLIISFHIEASILGFDPEDETPWLYGCMLIGAGALLLTIGLIERCRRAKKERYENPDVIEVNERLMDYIRWNSPEGVQVCLARGADPNWLQPGTGERPLTLWMARMDGFVYPRNSISILRALLDAGADQRLKNRERQTVIDVPVPGYPDPGFPSLYREARRLLRAAGRLVSLQHLAWAALRRTGMSRAPLDVPPVVAAQNRRWEDRNPAAFNRLLRAWK